MSITVAPHSVSHSRTRIEVPWQAMSILAIIGLLYWRVVLDLVNDWWTQENVSQGLLIVPFALWIAWAKRREIFAEPAEPRSRGLAVIALACVTYSLGSLAAEFFLTRISLVMLLAGLIYTFWGGARLRRLTFPLILLATAVPLPTIIYNSLAAPLQLLASDMASNIAHAVGVSVYRDGNIINLAHMSLGVEEACSGLNSLSAMLVASVLLGFLFCRKALSRWLLFLVSPAVAIGANILRVAGTAVLADYNEQFAKGFYHALSGWLIFLLGFAALFGLTKALAALEQWRMPYSVIGRSAIL